MRLVVVIQDHQLIKDVAQATDVVIGMLVASILWGKTPGQNPGSDLPNRVAESP